MLELTQKELKEILHYDPITGDFVWLAKRSKRQNIGDIAGTLTDGYISIGLRSRTHGAHRLAWLYMTGQWPKDQIDHINHIKNDNRWVNLREANQQENSKNQPLSKRNTSGITGVGWSKRSIKWYASIGINGKNIHLGFFTKKEDAGAARKKADIKHGFHNNHGEDKPNGS